MIGKLPDFFKPPHTIAHKDQNAPVLLALSGGADSVCLLHLLSEARRIYPFELFAAHVNHGIRGEEYGGEADRDEAFCRDLCQGLGVELFVERVNVPAFAKDSGESLETAARRVRYSFFAKIMRERGIELLVTAHNADDNFETQLFNLCRGCGIDGISGIPEIRPFPEADGVIVRPILSASKSEIFSYCKENGIEYVTDSTNFEDDCVRNKLRLNIIPQLKEIFGTPEKSGARLAIYAKETSDLIDLEVERLLSSLGNELNCGRLLNTHKAIAKRAIIMAFEKHSSETLEAIHVESILAFAAENKNGKLSLPGRVCADFCDGHLTFRPEIRGNEDIPLYSILLPFGITFIEGTDFAVSLSSESESLPPKEYELYDSTKISASAPLSARNRREGDKIIAGGMHKKVKKLMCDKKVPSLDRDTLPLIISGDEIIYAPKCATSDTAKATSKDKITISIYKKQI